MNALEAMSEDTGWGAYLDLGFRASPEKTVLAKRERYGPLAVQRPFYPEGKVCHVYLLHPPGGVAGGDQLQINVDLASASHGLVTTPGATKFYRSAGSSAGQTQRLRVADGASLEWLPQESIFFPGARVKMHTRVDLSGSGRLALWETHCLGRPAIQESFDEGSLDAGLELWRDGKPLLIERLRVNPDSRRRSSVLNGQPVTATAIFSHAEASHLDAAREQIDVDDQSIAAATLIGDLLLVRYLGNSTEQAKDLFNEIWGTLRELLLHRPVSAPRIWNT